MVDMSPCSVACGRLAAPYAAVMDAIYAMRGLCKLSSRLVGQCESLDEWDGDRHDSHAFVLSSHH